MTKIFTNNINDYINAFKSDILQTLDEYGIKPTPQNIDIEAAACIDSDSEYIKDILSHFDNMHKCQIYVAADLGLWYGRREGFKVFDSLLNAVLFCYEDDNTLYFKKKNTTLKLCACHHDGINNFNFYMLVNDRKKAITHSVLFEG